MIIFLEIIDADEILSKEEAFTQFKDQYNINDDQAKTLALTSLEKCNTIPDTCNPEAKQQMTELFTRYKSQIPGLYRMMYKN